MALKTKRRFTDLLPVTTPEEDELLEQDVLDNGIRDPIRILRGDVIIDGHRRHKLAKRHGLEYDVQVLDMTEDEAEIWMLTNQLGRRNLTREQAGTYRAKLYESLKKPHGGDRRSKRQVDVLDPNRGGTAQAVSEVAGVSPRTVDRDVSRQKIVDELPRDLQKQYAAGKLKGTDGQLQVLGSLDGDRQSKIARDVRTKGMSLADALKANGGPARPRKPRASKGSKSKPQKPEAELKKKLGGLYKTVANVRVQIDGLVATFGDHKTYTKQAMDLLHDGCVALKKWQGTVK